MYEFRWKGKDILELVDEAKKAAKRSPSYTDKEARTDVDWEKEGHVHESVPPQLVWVHDEGVYMMSNAEVLEGVKPLVKYAEGWNPKVVGWENAYLPGDDFAEFIDLGENLFAKLKPQDVFIIQLTNPHASDFQMIVEHRK